MNAAASPPLVLTKRPLSPLQSALLRRGAGDVDAWLAGMNGVALVFLMTALGAALPGSDLARPERLMTSGLAISPTETVEMELEAQPSMAPAPAASTETESPADRSEMSIPMEVAAFREMPELIDPVPIVEPLPRTPGPPGPVGAASAEAKSKPAQRKTAGAGPPQSESAAPRAAAAGRTGITESKGRSKGNTPQPPYPAFARRDQLQGTVVLQIAVNDGAVGSVRVLSSSGSAALDQYAVSHVQRRWRWEAGTTQSFTQPFRFLLK